jgi:5-methylcytosine-specific restriction endonuclease McrA
LIRAQAHQTDDGTGYLVKTAHGNMDGVTVFHCPFCGSGQVVNSGTSIECTFCHSSFTVLVQPQFPMMPQTVDGQPYTPGQQPGNDPTTPAPAAAPGGEDDEGSFGGDQLSEKLPDDSSGDAAGGDDSGNPFAKKDDSDKPPAPKESSLRVEAIPQYQQKALDKIHAAPQPTAADHDRYAASVAHNKRPGGELRGNDHDRHRRTEKLLNEFGNGKTAKCSYCGTKVDASSIQHDKIYPHNGYRYNNVIPACRHCNQSRGNADVHTFMETHRRKAASLGAYITEEGVVLSEDEYMAHLAIKFSPHRDETLAEVKQQLHGRY